jgi:tRNA G18 (ribose-2'-O)-methylase SpoU
LAFRKLSTSELLRLTVDEFRRTEKIPVVIVLDNIRSMNNVGSIFRSADGFLMEGIVLCGYTPRPPHRDIEKTALGATDTVHWEYREHIIEALQELNPKGYKICALEQVEGSVMLQEWAPAKDEKWALVLGNEVEGVQDEVLKICDRAVEIPQGGMKHSLNVAVAAAIVMYKIYELVD